MSVAVLYKTGRWATLCSVGFAVYFLAALSEEGDRIAGLTLGDPAQTVVSLFVLAISRYREYVADADAAGYTGGRALASAPQKIRPGAQATRADPASEVSALYRRRPAGPARHPVRHPPADGETHRPTRRGLTPLSSFSRPTRRSPRPLEGAGAPGREHRVSGRVHRSRTDPSAKSPVYTYAGFANVSHDRVSFDTNPAVVQYAMRSEIANTVTQRPQTVVRTGFVLTVPALVALSADPAAGSKVSTGP